MTSELMRDPPVGSSKGDPATFSATLLSLHEALRPRMRDRHLDLHAHGTYIVSPTSAACATAFEGQTLHYFRSKEQAMLVERLMGRDSHNPQHQIEIHRHPTIEIRLTPMQIAIELIVAPAAWWDQRNLIGKLRIERHREAFRALLGKLERDYVIGFWSGTALADEHVTPRHLLHGSLLNEWMATFHDGQDCLRVGAWLEPDISGDDLLRESLARIETLYSLYEFIAWTSNNNFQAFYQQDEGARA